MTLSSTCLATNALFPDRYAVAGILREGANSTVYRGRDRESGLEVVLKCFEPERHGTYLREMAAGFGLTHLSLVYCLDTFYLSDGRGCTVYEYMAGGTLLAYLQNQPTLAPSEVFRCVRDLLNALHYLHQLDRIHCDLKPENIYLRTTADGDSEYLLGDLGAACTLREARQGRHTTGSPAYMAPERFYDRFFYNSDLYSLGVLLFELCTGQRPFIGSAAEVTRAHLSQAPACEDIEHPPLSDLCERLLEKDPQARLADAEVTLYLLDQIEAGASSIETDLTTAPTATAASAPIPLRELRLQPYFRQQLKHQPNACAVFVHAQRALVALEFASHLELIASDSNQAAQVVLHSGPYQVLDAQHLAYTAGKRLFRHDLHSQQRQLLYQASEPIAGFCLQADKLLWRGQRGWHFHDLSKLHDVSFRTANYLLDSCACFLQNQYLLTSAGALNQDLILRDLNAKQVAQWPLDGPILALSAASDCADALALSLNAGHHERYSLWRISSRSGAAPSKLELAQGVRHWCFSSGHFFWLQANSLYGCGPDLEPQVLNQLPISITALSVSYDHSFIAALSPSSQGAELSLWHNQG